MAGMGQSCNHVAAAMYRIKAAVRNGLTNPSCTSTADQWFSNHKDNRPMKVKDMKFRREYFCQRGKGKLLLVTTPKEKYNPLSEQGNMKMLTLIDFSESLRGVCSKNILFSAFPKPDVDFISDFVTQQVDEVPDNLSSVYDWISKSRNVEGSFSNLFVDMTKEKMSKIELLTTGQNNNKLWYNYRKGFITASKAHSVFAKMNKVLKSAGGCVNIWSLCQNISGLFLDNPDLSSLIYGRTMEMEAANDFFQLMKKKHKKLFQSVVYFWIKKIVLLDQILTV